jgi:hypothetical protein
MPQRGSAAAALRQINLSDDTFGNRLFVYQNTNIPTDRRGMFRTPSNISSGPTRIGRSLLHGVPELVERLAR